MKATDSGARPSRRLQVFPQPRGGWILLAEGQTLSEHTTATEAERAARACLHDGDELVVVDRYHRCHRRTRPASTRELIRSQTGCQS